MNRLKCSGASDKPLIHNHSHIFPKSLFDGNENQFGLYAPRAKPPVQKTHWRRNSRLLILCDSITDTTIFISFKLFHAENERSVHKYHCILSTVPTDHCFASQGIQSRHIPNIRSNLQISRVIVNLPKATAIDAETKLVPAYKVGKRTTETTRSFIKDLQYRISTRFQLSTDSFNPYFNVVDMVFGDDVDYGQIHKEYAEDSKGEKRYSPAQIIRVIINPLIGQPVREYISTSYIERQNPTMRMQMRRFARLTNAFSKKLRNLESAVALHFYHYNFMRIHQSLKVTPAMQANDTHRLWTWENLLFST